MNDTDSKSKFLSFFNVLIYLAALGLSCCTQDIWVWWVGFSLVVSSCGWPTNWRTITPKKFLHYGEGSEPQVRLSSLGIGQKDWESPGNLALKVCGIWLQDFHRTRGNRGSSLGGHKQNLAHSKTRGKEQWPHRRLNHNCLLVLEGLLWGRGLTGAHHRDRGMGSIRPGRPPSA